jgi:hypothetical protein
MLETCAAEHRSWCAHWQLLRAVSRLFKLFMTNWRHASRVVDRDVSCEPVLTLEVFVHGEETKDMPSTCIETDVSGKNCSPLSETDDVLMFLSMGLKIYMI